MSQNCPSLSVVMPVHNGDEYLSEAIASVTSQTWQDFELVVVNDGSTDQTAAILGSCEDPRLRVINNETNLGVTESLNPRTPIGARPHDRAAGC